VNSNRPNVQTWLEFNLQVDSLCPGFAGEMRDCYASTDCERFAKMRQNHLEFELLICSWQKCEMARQKMLKFCSKKR